MEELSRFFTIMGAIFVASSAITDQFKARWPWLGKPLDNPQEEKKRELRVILFNAIIAALLAGMVSVDVFALLGLDAFAGLKIAYPALYLLVNMLAVGLMSNFGSTFLYEILKILVELRESIRLRNRMAVLLQIKKDEPIRQEK